MVKNVSITSANQNVTPEVLKGFWEKVEEFGVVVKVHFIGGDKMGRISTVGVGGAPGLDNGVVRKYHQPGERLLIAGTGWDVPMR